MLLIFFDISIRFLRLIFLIGAILYSNVLYF